MTKATRNVLFGNEKVAVIDSIKEELLQSFQPMKKRRSKNYYILSEDQKNYIF